ncbi:MAG: hypothetical protein ACFFBV_12495 [Promethearchaeota archaeon]
MEFLLFSYDSAKSGRDGSQAGLLGRGIIWWYFKAGAGKDGINWMGRKLEVNRESQMLRLRPLPLE